MKTLTFLILSLCCFVSFSYAGYVNGYTKSDGTYVNGYNRSDANDTKSDNYGSPSAYDNRYNVPAQNRDYDGDGIPNRYDSDDNNDGKLDDNE